VSAYKDDPRVEIGLYEATVATADGLCYVYATTKRDWVAAPFNVRHRLADATDRGDAAALRAIHAAYPHFGSFDEAIRSLIEDPR
jgi:hypothetical protein